MDNFLDRLTLEGAGGQTDDTRSTFRPPWKLWGITVQTSYWEGQWHQDCGYTSLIFLPCFGRQKLGECDKMRSVSKNMRCPKKQARPQFSKYQFQNESAASHRLWANADSFWKQYFENCGRACSFLHIIFLLTDRIWSPSTDFGWPKQGRNCPAATFRPKGVCSLMYTRLFTFYGPS